jgi:hypothetical protein
MKHGFDKIESEKSGAGKHGRFHRMVKEFGKIHLE